MTHLNKWTPLAILTCIFAFTLPAWTDIAPVPRNVTHFRGLFSSNPEYQMEAEANAFVEREERITELLRIVNIPDIETNNSAALASAIYLLGEYRAAEAANSITEHLTFQLKNDSWHSLRAVPEQEKYPAVTALISIGDLPETSVFLMYKVGYSDNAKERELAAYVLAKTMGKKMFIEKLEKIKTSSSVGPNRNFQQALDFVKTVHFYAATRTNDGNDIPQKYFLGLFSPSPEVRQQTLDNARKGFNQQNREQDKRIQELIKIIGRSYIDESFGGPLFSALQLLGEYRASAAISAIADWLTYLPELPPRTSFRLTTEQEKHPAVRALIRINDGESTFTTLNIIIAKSPELQKRELAGYVLAKILGREETISKLEQASKTANEKSKKNYQQAIEFVKTVSLRPKLPQLTITPLSAVSKSQTQSSFDQDDLNITLNKRKNNLSKTDILSKIRVTLSTQHTQKIAHGGIHLTVQIHNDAEYDNYISNPFDTFFVRLTNEDIRKEILLPIAGSRILGRPGQMSDANKISVPFTIHKVLLNGKELTPKEMESYCFIISPKSTFTFEIELDKKQKYTEADLGYTGGLLTKEQLSRSMETINLPADHYCLSVSMFLSAPFFLHNANENRRSLSFEPVRLNIELVP